MTPKSECRRPTAPGKSSDARTKVRIDRRLVLFAVEPTGVGAYVEAVQELIDQVVPQPAPSAAEPPPALAAPRLLRVVR